MLQRIRNPILISAHQISFFIGKICIHSASGLCQSFQEGQERTLAFCWLYALALVLAFVLAEWVGAALPWLMSAAAGCMVCVTAQEMIPEAVEPDEVAGVISIVLGFALMMALDVAL